MRWEEARIRMVHRWCELERRGGREGEKLGDTILEGRREHRMRAISFCCCSMKIFQGLPTMILH